MKLPSFITTLAAASLVLFVSAVGADEGPAYPGQPRINNALKHLTAAQTQAPTDAKAALVSLQEAGTALGKAIHNKGTYVPIARQLTAEATRHLEQGDVEAASHDIQKAIDAVNRAGQTGEH